MYKGVIFDLDGTLLDTIADLKQAADAALKKEGLSPLSDKDILQCVGQGFGNLVKTALKIKNYDFDEAKFQEVLHNFELAYEQCYNQESKPYHNIDALLSKLKVNQIKMAINTNKRESFAQELFKKHFNDYGIEFLYGEISTRPKKPDPSACHEIISKSNLTYDEVIYVGDSEVDITTAKNAGLKVIYVNWGFRNLEQVKHLEPDYIVNDAMEIAEIILKGGQNNA